MDGVRQQYIHATTSEWKSNRWRVAFYLNDTQIWQDVQIKPNLSYHVVVGTNNDARAEYQILDMTSPKQ